MDPSPRTTALELCGHPAAAERGRLHWKSKRPPRPSSSFHNTGVALNRSRKAPIGSVDDALRLPELVGLSGGGAQRRAHGRGFASATRAAWPSVQVPAIHQFQQQIWLGERGHRAQHRRKQRWRDLRLRLWEPQLLRSHRRRQGSSRLHSPGCAGQQAARRDHVQGQELGR